MNISIDPPYSPGMEDHQTNGQPLPPPPTAYVYIREVSETNRKLNNNNISPTYDGWIDLRCYKIF